MPKYLLPALTRAFPSRSPLRSNRPGLLGVLRTEGICPSTSVVPIRLLTFSLRRVNSILVVAPEQSGYKDYIMNNLDLLRHVDLIQIPHLSLLA